MICPKCGAEISENANRCGNCGLKVNIRCPECNTINPFGIKSCKNCGFDFLIQCQVCGSTNIYLAKECRKCHSILIPKKKQPLQKEQETTSRIKINNEIEVVNAFSSENSLYPPKVVNKTEKEEPIQQEATEIKPADDGGIPFVEDKIEEAVKVEESHEEPEEPAFETFFKPEEEHIPEPILQIEQTIQTIDETNVETVEETVPINTDKNEIISEKKDTKEVKNSQQDIKDIQEEEQNIETEKKEEENNTDFLEEIVEIEDLPIVEDIEQSEQITEVQTEEEKQEFIEEQNIDIQIETVEKTINLLTNSLQKHIIALNGPEGCGKTAVLNQVNYRMSQNGYIALYGSCTPLVQITSFGFFQDAFLRMMEFPPYTNSTESFAKDFKRSKFAKIFNSLNSQELELFLNMLYPSQKDVFENILENKKKMFTVLEKAIKSFLTNNNLIIIIDNFELLDGASYDFLMHILKKGFFNNRLKLLVAYQENKSIQTYFDITSQEEKIFETILLKKFDREELINIVNNNFMFNIEEVIEQEYLEEIINKSKGNAIRLEQEIALLIDTGYISIENNKIYSNIENLPDITPETVEQLIKLRLNALTPAVRNILYMAAIMGYRFATGVLCQASELNLEKATQILSYLIREMYITQVDKYTCEFKNLTIWKLVYQEAKEDLLYRENSEKLYQTLRQLILSSNLQKLISCTEALSKNEAFLIWQSTASITSKLGDTNLYVIAQKECLKILEEQDMDDSDEIKAQIYEEIGKLLYEKSPKEAITYLANVLDSEIRASNIRKIIDISGYFIKSCYLSGNYFGVTEAVDTIIKQLEDSSSSNSTDIALVKSRKLRALLNIGNSEQIINIANEEIIPELERYLETEQKDTKYKSLILNALLLTKIVLAKAYGIQGNSQINNTVIELRQLLDKYRNNSDYYLVQTDIIDAFSKTISGDINQSNNILNHISSAYQDRKMETNLLAEWNLVNIINRVLSGQRNDLKIDLFELAAFTNNINEHFIKNIVKLILGYILKEEGDTVKALEIFNEEITYFAKEKVAIGALLSWAMIVQTSLEMGDEIKAMDTANKSLDIAKSPKINNYFFIIYFKRILAQIYLNKGDLEAAKMYLEEALVIAKQMGLKYQLVELYIDYATYTEEVMRAKRIYSSENIKIAYDLYNKAFVTAKELKLSNLSDKAFKARAGFKTFCQLNSIEL